MDKQEDGWIWALIALPMVAVWFWMVWVLVEAGQM